MHKGHIYILQYIKNLEDQVLVDNFPVGKELVRNKPIVENLIDWLLHAKKLHEIGVPKLHKHAYECYDALESGLPEQKYGLGWMESDGKFQNEGNRYE